MTFYSIAGVVSTFFKWTSRGHPVAYIDVHGALNESTSHSCLLPVCREAVPRCTQTHMSMKHHNLTWNECSRMEYTVQSVARVAPDPTQTSDTDSPIGKDVPHRSMQWN